MEISFKTSTKPWPKFQLLFVELIVFSFDSVIYSRPTFPRSKKTQLLATARVKYL